MAINCKKIVLYWQYSIVKKRIFISLKIRHFLRQPIDIVAFLKGLTWVNQRELFVWVRAS